MNASEINTDYLVVGAGAAGMAITDELLTHSNASITIVDRRHAPGGHWIDAYPYVRLHQPSAFYGVTSVPMGKDAIDVAGTNAGYYELAGADEIRAYYANVMQNHFLPTGRVRYFPCCNYVGEHRFVSRLSGALMKVHVQRRLVDTAYGAEWSVECRRRKLPLLRLRPQKTKRQGRPTLATLHAHGLIAKFPRTRRRRVSLYGRRVMGTAPIPPAKETKKLRLAQEKW